MSFQTRKYSDINSISIYKSKVKGKIPTFATVNAYIKYVMNIENHAVIANGQICIIRLKNYLSLSHVCI
jgi:hypothetical protein